MTGIPWQAWAPPLDPPTPGGLPADVAQQIVDACPGDPHLAAALQWEAYAAMLPPTPSVSSVSTGMQSVQYQPAAPGGDYGLAIARAEWHRSFTGTGTIPLVLAHPGPGWPLPVGIWWETEEMDPHPEQWAP